jgi:hypothetical protein
VLLEPLVLLQQYREPQEPQALAVDQLVQLEPLDKQVLLDQQVLLDKLVPQVVPQEPQEHRDKQVLQD